MNKEKGAANVFLIILIVILAAVVVYLAFIRKPVAQDAQPSVAQSTNESNPNEVPMPTIASSTKAGWNTYTNNQYGFSFEYPSYLKISYAGAEGNRPFLIRLDNINDDNDSTAKSVELDYVPTETMSSFVSVPWGHSATDKHTDTTINGNQAVIYDLIQPDYGMGEGSVEGYTRFVQAGIQSPEGKFINVVAQTGFADKVSAQNADESWANSVINSVNL